MGSCGDKGLTMKILLIEDDQVDAMAFTRAVSLSSPNDSVTVVRDGEEAIEWLSRGQEGGLPSLVFLDLNLPRMSGFEVLRKLRDDERLAQLVVFAYSSSSHEVDIREAYRYQVAGYLVKSEFQGDSKVLGDLLRIYRSHVALLPSAV